MKTVIAIDRRGEVYATGYGSTIEAAENQTRLLLREVITRTGRAWREFTFLYDADDVPHLWSKYDPDDKRKRNVPHKNL